LTTQADLPPFIVTLGMMGICRGLAKIWTDAQNIDVSGTPSVTRFGSERVLADWVPVPVLVLIVVALAAFFILRFTALGRYCYAMGSNKEAARLSGVNVKLYTTAVFVICGLLSGLAGVVQAARVGIGQPTGGMGYELDGIAAAVIGGASLMGGVGTISGTILGALIMAVLRSGCDLKGVSPHLQDVVIGGVIVLAVLVDRIRQR
jgi:ribose transport system permease protein